MGKIIFVGKWESPHLNSLSTHYPQGGTPDPPQKLFCREKKNQQQYNNNRVVFLDNGNTLRQTHSVSIHTH